MAAVLLLVLPAGGQTPADARPSAPPASRAAWREVSDYVRLFAPRNVRPSYRAFVSTLSLAEVLVAVTADAASMRPPGAWVAQPQSPWDAFGQGGLYDRMALARLYGARRPLVARGPRGLDERVEESWALISPYPAPALDRLEPGTLLLILRLP